MSQLRALGVPEDQIEPVARSQQDRATPMIWPENEKSLRLFLAVQTQWCYLAGFGVVAATGLDYTRVEATARMAKIPMTTQRFDDIRVMEAEARSLMNGAPQHG